jgi:hypothetical protein
LQRLEFKKQLDVDSKTHSKRNDGKRPPRQLLILTSESDPSDWVQHTQAGCVFWVHQRTGDVSLRPPQEERGGEENTRGAERATQRKGEPVVARADDERGGWGGERVSPPTLATGSLVYQSEEYDELMRLLGSSEA